jgi:four helix bundle protein
MLRILESMKEFTKIVYDTTMIFPKNELYNLTSQIQRACVSVRLNIREGNTFEGDRKKNFFKIAMGSLEEVDECMLIALEREYINDSEHNAFRTSYWFIFNMLKKLIHSDLLVAGGHK